MMFTKILLPSDGSDGALKAAMVAAEMAKRFDAKLTMLSVVTLPVALVPLGESGAGFIEPIDFQRYSEEIKDSVERRTGRVLEELGVKYEVEHQVGHAADAIIRAAEDGKFDLIVMGSRGLGTVKSFLLGSVSDRVLHHAHCPVLIAR